jgi:hypothetical protein
MIDWSGEFNSFLTPFSPFGMATVSRTVQPQLPEYLWALSKSEGADQTLAAQYGSAVARNGEPFGEIAQVDQHDAAWGAQRGGPRDPQAGNAKGKRDVLRTSGTLVLDKAPLPASNAAGIAFSAATFVAPAVMPPTSAVNSSSRASMPLKLAGPAGALATYTITDGLGGSVTGTATIGDDGSASIFVDVSTLADGTLTATVMETDVLGNTAPGTPGSWQKDTSGPTGGFLVNGAIPLNGVVATRNRFLSLSLSCTDVASGVAQMSFSLDGGATWQVTDPYGPAEAVALGTTDGLYTILAKITDGVGNSTLLTQQVRLDTTGPTITDSIADGFIYDVGQTITLTFGGSDVDGIKSISASLDNKVISSGSPVQISIDGLKWGTHTLVITATDNLGNTSSVTVQFVVRATTTGLINALNDGVASGKITANANNLMTKLQAAQAAVQRGDRAGAKNLLATFVNQVQSQAGKGITSDYATLLIGWTNDLIARL